MISATYGNLSFYKPFMAVPNDKADSTFAAAPAMLDIQERQRPAPSEDVVGDLDMIESQTLYHVSH
jgi:hypothetical protein